LNELEIHHSITLIEVIFNTLDDLKAQAQTGQYKAPDLSTQQDWVLVLE